MYVTKEMTKEELFYWKLKNDRVWYIENFLKIRDKKSRLVPFKLNKAQSIVEEKIKWCEENNKLKRFIVLKARQMGLSTLFEGLIFQDTSTNSFKNSMIIAHEDKATSNLFAMSKLFLDELPDVLRPMIKYSNEKALVFENPSNDIDEKKKNPGLRSKITISTAGTTEAGRSATIHNLHACLHKDSLIVLANGTTKSIKDICIGDTVVTSSGCFANISNKWNVGEKDTFAINTWLSNENLYVTKEHKILTQDGYKVCSDLKQSDFIKIPTIEFKNTDKTYKYHIEQNSIGKKYNTDISFEYNYDFGYLVGYYLAEGYIIKQSSTQKESYSGITFTCEKNETFIENALKCLSDITYTRKDVVFEGTNKKQITLYSKTLAHAINNLCGRTTEKHIPHNVFDTNCEFAKGIIRGLYDGDGSKTKLDRVSLTTVHENLARQLKRMIIAVGYGVPSVSYRTNKFRYGVKNKDIYLIDMNGDTFKRYNGIVVDTPHKATKYKYIDGDVFVKVRRIEPYESSTVYDVEVNHSDHNFETPIGIVSNSEVAFFPDAKTTMLGLLQSIPDEMNTLVVLESTANGVGDWFHDMWQKAVKGENEFIPIFLPWFIDPAYTRPFSSKAEKQQFIDEINIVTRNTKGDPIRTYEYELMEKHNLTYEQLNWRKYTIKNKCHGDEILFMQEYPSTADEAFISSGRPKFSIKALKKYETITAEPTRGYLKADEVGEVTFFEDPQGYISIWKQPEPDKFYCIGADVAEGLAQGDYSCAVVGDADTFDIIAMWHGHIDPDLFGIELIKLGKFYNEAYLGVENNNHGLTTLTTIKREEYWNIFFSKSYDRISDTITQKIGWSTTSRTKPLMIDKLAEFVREMYIGIYSSLIISEMFTYVIDDKGHTNAQIGCFDDTVMATGILLQLLLEGKSETFIPEVPIDQRKKIRREIIDPLFEENGDLEYSE